MLTALNASLGMAASTSPSACLRLYCFVWAYRFCGPEQANCYQRYRIDRSEHAERGLRMLYQMQSPKLRCRRLAGETVRRQRRLDHRPFEIRQIKARQRNL